ncbi:MAG: peptidoglycan DD-metalloendopeptidase family protein [Pseudomonadota bacterium]|nr:peptidoglycan DD-metalloendopeptidase family protein [Pseudomonadota bacterium]
MNAFANEYNSKEEATADLKAITEKSEALQRDLEKQQKLKAQEKQNLAQIEQSLQVVLKELKQISNQQEKLLVKDIELNFQANFKEKELTELRLLLNQQLRASYINGNEELLKIFLTQNDPSQLSRQQTYYNYLTTAKFSMINKSLEKIAELEAKKSEIELNLKDLSSLEKQRSATFSKLSSFRKQRELIIASLTLDIATQGDAIEALKKREAKLRDLVVELDQLQKDSINNLPSLFSTKKASLKWPTDGALLSRFGQTRAAGGMKWQGVLIGAEEGTPVRNIYNGRVVFADWLDGMGLLIIVEHGDGYMSLYGHNQLLLKEVGQPVRLGEVIAEVGDSGGQAIPALYFEIRKDGTALNPRSWIK